MYLDMYMPWGAHVCCVCSYMHLPCEVCVYMCVSIYVCAMWGACVFVCACLYMQIPCGECVHVCVCICICHVGYVHVCVCVCICHVGCLYVHISCVLSSQQRPDDRMGASAAGELWAPQCRLGEQNSERAASTLNH